MLPGSDAEVYVAPGATAAVAEMAPPAAGTQSWLTASDRGPYSCVRPRQSGAGRPAEQAGAEHRHAAALTADA